MAVFDRVIGIQHFLFDKVPKNVPEVSPKPRHENRWIQDGKSVVAKVHCESDIQQCVIRVMDDLGPLTSLISRGDKVMVKPNFNSDDPPPASTDPAFLKVIIQILLDIGAKVTIGESSGGIWRPTATVFRHLHLYEFARDLGVRLIAFEEETDGWVKIKIPGEYLGSVIVARSAYEADRLIYLPCLKTHRLARYSGALKLAFGFVHPGQRRAFHLRYREEKLAEISLCWQPDIVVMDGRKAFVTGGPQRGRVVEPEVILASGDPIAIDVEAVRTLMDYKARNKLRGDPWRLPQITTAMKHQLGNEYVLKP